ncbi:gp436 family protein [Avibacterium endocarditidis]|uniref:gp436 family protein n=1 Tax=Avibacterium endocarditidis TaxID=380674 RepID=UPI003BF7DE93
MYIQPLDLLELVSERILIELSNDSSRATEINTAVLEKACLHACEMVDGHLRSRYRLPLEQVPTLVRNLCLQLARYWLYSRRPDGKGFPDQVKDSYAQALKDLERIQSGKLHLGLTELVDTMDDNVPAVPRFVARAPEKVDLSGY